MYNIFTSITPKLSICTTKMGCITPPGTSKGRSKCGSNITLTTQARTPPPPPKPKRMRPRMVSWVGPSRAGRSVYSRWNDFNWNETCGHVDFFEEIKLPISFCQHERIDMKWLSVSGRLISWHVYFEIFDVVYFHLIKCFRWICCKVCVFSGHDFDQIHAGISHLMHGLIVVQVKQRSNATQNWD